MTLLIATEKGLFSDTRCINHGYVTKGDKTLQLENYIYAAFSGSVPTEHPNRANAIGAMSCVYVDSYLATMRERKMFTGSILNYLEPILTVLRRVAVSLLTNADSPVMMAVTQNHTYMFHTEKVHVRFTPKQVPWAFGSSGTLAKNLLQVYSDELDVYARCSKYDGMINTEVRFNDRSVMNTPVPDRRVFASLKLYKDNWDKEESIGMICLFHLLAGIAVGKNGKLRKRFPNKREFAEINDKINRRIDHLETTEINVIKDMYDDLFRSK